MITFVILGQIKIKSSSLVCPENCLLCQYQNDDKTLVCKKNACFIGAGFTDDEICES